MEGWLNLVKFLTSQFGLPGTMAVCLAGYLIYLLKLERAAHDATRDKIDAINEKRIEMTTSLVLTQKDLRDSLEAVTAILGKQK